MRTAFTLVELLIVVVILAVLAMLVVPRFADSTEEAKLASLQNNLAIFRSLIHRYTIEHGGRTPAHDETGAVDTNQNRFRNRLRSRTLPDGKISAAWTLGPYMIDGVANSFNNLKSLRINGAAAGAGTHGWHFDATTGRVSADDSAAHASL